MSSAHHHLSRRPYALLSFSVLLLTGGASAAGAEVKLGLSPAGASASSSQSGATTPKTDAKPATTAGESWFTAHRPQAGTVEIGLFGGALFPSSSHNLRDPALPHQPLDAVAPELGLRLAYFPLTFLGVEAEGMAAPTGTRDGGSAGLIGGRLHGVAQLPWYSVVPFVVLGAGGLQATSDAMGRDSDPALHFGIGVKAPIDDLLGVRVDLRDNLTQKLNSAQDTLTHHPEFLVGLSLALDPRAKKPVAADADGDGIADDKDACPSKPSTAADGCPVVVPDSDGDGLRDDVDECRKLAGPAPTGCPLPDCDADGVADAADKCPTAKGATADGCPPVDPDADHDGVQGAADRCPTQPESVNGFEDQDGCPDELPRELAKFNSVIQGINFGTNSSKITAGSRPTLDDAAATLIKYPELRVRISGHTDDTGKREANLALSQERAAAVKAYLVSKGVSAERLESRGAGPDEPAYDNKTAEGRSKNRRIEFTVLKNAAPVAPAEK